jgi:hypothetical protein
MKRLLCSDFLYRHPQYLKEQILTSRRLKRITGWIKSVTESDERYARAGGSFASLPVPLIKLTGSLR